MLEKPALPDEKIAACLQGAYGLTAVRITFLPLGADLNTAVYHIQTPNQTPYFFKLRSGPFDPASVTLPHLLHEQVIRHIIAPLPAPNGRLWTTLDDYTTTLYPYIEGKNGYEVGLSDEQWVEFGKALRRFHTADLPPSLTNTIRRENYAPQWREMVKHYLAHIENGPFDDPIAADLAAYLKRKQNVIVDLIGRAEQQAQILQTQSPEFIVCHADIHAGNVHITARGDFYLIDWDTLILAPKERDLMSIGGGLMGRWRTPQEEGRLFYQGYGQCTINSAALTYYRCERIIEDIAIEWRQIFSAEGIVEDRERALYYLKSNFRPGDTIDLAFQSSIR